MNNIIEQIEWVRGQIGLEWKKKSNKKNLGGEAYDYHEQRTSTYSSETSNGTKIVIQENGRFWRGNGKNDSPYDDIHYTDRSTCTYKLQIIPKNGKDFACGSREIDNDGYRNEIDSELESLFREIARSSI